MKATDGVNFDEFKEVYGSKTSFVSLIVDDSTPKIFVGRTRQSPVYCLDLPTAQWKAIETNTPGGDPPADGGELPAEQPLSRPIAYKDQIIFLGDTEVWILDTTTFQWRVQVAIYTRTRTRTHTHAHVVARSWPVGLLAKSSTMPICMRTPTREVYGQGRPVKGLGRAALH